MIVARERFAVETSLAVTALLCGSIVVLALPVRGQVIQRETAPASVSGSATAASGQAPASAPGATVPPVKRVQPKTPPLPDAVAKAIRTTKARGAAPKSAAKSSKQGAVATVGSLPAPKSCAAGEVLVRKTGQCQKRSAVTTTGAAAKSKRR